MKSLQRYFLPTASVSALALAAALASPVAHAKEHMLKTQIDALDQRVEELAKRVDELEKEDIRVRSEMREQKSWREKQRYKDKFLTQ